MLYCTRLDLGNPSCYVIHLGEAGIELRDEAKPNL